jgi:hypothetical protein
MKKGILPQIIFLLILSMVGCNLPIKATPKPVIIPTSDVTKPTEGEAAPIVLTPFIQTATAETGNPTDLPQGEPATATVRPEGVTPTLSQLPPTATLVAPTATRVPPTAVPPTPTIPTMRSGPSALASFLTTRPVINGDWTDLPTPSERPAQYVVYGKGNWGGEDDLSGSFRIAWDQDYLYIAVKVRDHQYVQESAGKDLFKGDSIEILLDTNVRGDYYVDSLNTDDYQIGISAGKVSVGKNLEAYLWYPAAKAGARIDIKIGATSSAGIYRAEAAIPWSLLEITPANGLHLGFAVSISDNDTPGHPGQKTMVSSVPLRDFLDPTTWADLTLKK